MQESFNSIFNGSFCAISKYLSIKDVYEMSKTTKRAGQFINKNYLYQMMERKILAKLKKIIFPNTFDDFCAKMTEAKAVIGGSFLHQCILNENYSSDIDIYVGSKEGNEILHDFFMNYTFPDDNYSSLYNTLPHLIDIMNYNYYPNEDDDPNGGLTIQLIHVDTSDGHSLWKHVCHTGFDIFRNMAYFDRNGKLRLKLTNYVGIINKHIKYTVLDVKDFFFRYNKYLNRNYTFELQYDRIDCLEYMLMKHPEYRIKNAKINPYRFEESHYRNCCLENCPLSFLFPEFRHYHHNVYSKKKNKNYYFINIEDKNGFFSKNLLFFNPGDTEWSVEKKKAFGLLKKRCDNLDFFVKITRKLRNPTKVDKIVKKTTNESEKKKRKDDGWKTVTRKNKKI